NRRSKSTAELYLKLLSLGINRPYAAIEEYRAVAESLLAARRKLRPAQKPDGTVSPPALRDRQTAQLLAILSDETLYAAALRFPEASRGDWLVTYETIDDLACSDDGKTPRTVVFRGIKFCQGDIIVTKADSLFSSVLARRLRHPQHFSHSSVAAVAPGDSRSLRLFDSDGADDGVKLRDPVRNFSDATRLFVYRLREKDPHRRRTLLSAVVSGSDRYLADMRRLTNGDAEGKAAYPFDFRVRIDDSSEQRCSEVPHIIYGKGGVTDGRNPYPRILWSAHNDMGVEVSKVPALVNLIFAAETATAPEAGDIEFNPNFDVAAALVIPERLARERIDAAIIDVMFAYLSEDVKGVRTRYTTFLSAFDNDPVTATGLETLRRSGFFNNTLVAAIAARTLARTHNFSIKMAIFYVGVNSLL
ncbi:MAG: hypothetical protein Q7R41_14755, partial [Phycisphaerales bacterium]|nr:hypothetical protein [Phycisphaerales bacterium]